MESITISLPKKMPLPVRISETGTRLRDWLQSLGFKFSDERYRLQLTGWDLTDHEFHYHFTILKGESSAAVKSGRKAGSDLDYYSGPAADEQLEHTLTDLSPDY